MSKRAIKRTTVVPVSELSLGDYLRWLASTFEQEHAVRDELARRAGQADELLAALKVLFNDFHRWADTSKCPSGRLARPMQAIRAAEGGAA